MRADRTAAQIRWKWAAIMAAFLLLCGTGCQRRMLLKSEMSWECPLPQPWNAGPHAQLVRFRYVKDPRFFEEVSGMNLCDQLRRSGKKIVTLESQAWGRSHLIGYRHVSVDGLPIGDVGGWGSSGANDAQGLNPLAQAFEGR